MRAFVAIVAMLGLCCPLLAQHDRQDIERAFQERWLALEETHPSFPLWEAHWTKEDLKTRFEKMYQERWELYFENPEDMHKEGAIGRHRPLYRVPDQFASFGSRYPYSATFDYNAASPCYNASVILLQDQLFLALEAPTEKNVSAFFHVLEDYSVTDLVRLTPARSGAKENSYPYWEGHLDIDTKTGCSLLKSQRTSFRYIAIESWPDHEGLSSAKLIALVKAVQNRSDPSQRIAIHCRAGVGRTGTFLAAYALIKEIDSQVAAGIAPDHIQVSVDKVVWELSLQRPFMITHFPQYECLYQLVNDYVTALTPPS